MCCPIPSIRQQLPRCFLSIRSNNNIPKKYTQTASRKRTASKTDYYLTYQNRKALISLPSIGCCYATLTHRSIISSSAFFHVYVCQHTSQQCFTIENIRGEEPTTTTYYYNNILSSLHAKVLASIPLHNIGYTPQCARQN